MWSPASTPVSWSKILVGNEMPTSLPANFWVAKRNQNEAGKISFFLNCTQPPITSHFLFSLVSGDADFSAYFFSCQLDRKFGRFNPQVPLLQPPFDLIKSQFFWVEPLPKISQNDFRFET
jgi:hypothetical protein